MEKLKTVGAREGKTEYQTMVKAWIEERLQSAGDKGRALRISLRAIDCVPTLRRSLDQDAREAKAA